MTEPVLVSPRLIYVERVIGIPDLELFDLSKDGKTALALSNKTGSYQLAALDVRGGQIRLVSHGKERVAWARISNDSQTVCFSRDFGGKEEHQLFTVPLEEGEEEEQLTRLPPTRAFNFNWSNGDDRIALAGATRETNAVWTSGLSTQATANTHRSFRTDTGSSTRNGPRMILESASPPRQQNTRPHWNLFSCPLRRTMTQ